jgi:hypothetical protein
MHNESHPSSVTGREHRRRPHERAVMSGSQLGSSTSSSTRPSRASEGIPIGSPAGLLQRDPVNANRRGLPCPPGPDASPPYQVASPACAWLPHGVWPAKAAWRILRPTVASMSCAGCDRDEFRDRPVEHEARRSPPPECPRNLSSEMRHGLFIRSEQPPLSAVD